MKSEKNPSKSQPLVDETAKSEINLSVFLTEDFPGLDFSQKALFLQELAIWVRENHEAGRFFRGRVTQSVRFCREWKDRLRFKRRIESMRLWPDLCLKKKIRDLADLYAQGFLVLSRNERFRFLRAYAGQDLKLKDLRALAAEIERAALKKVSRRIRRQEKACWKNNQDFLVENAGRFLVRRQNSDRAAALALALFSDPEGLLATGERLPGRGSNCTAIKIIFGDRSYVVKRYASRNWVYKLKHIFRHPRGVRVWGASWGMLARGVAIPKPLLCLEERHACFPGASYLVFEFFPESRTLTRIWPEAGDRLKKELLAKLAISLGKLHRLKTLHGDTNWDNVLVGKNDQLVLIDLDCSRSPQRMGAKRKEKDIQHVLRDLYRLDKKGGEWETFFHRVWRKWAFALSVKS